MKTNFKKNGGFTLVELIVVIAILAILAAVAVPAYSGYIEKANKQTDLSLISDIEQALTLASISGTLETGDSGYLVLSTSGLKNAADIVGTDLEKALVDTFGTNYASTMKLTYGAWGNKGLTDMTLEDAEAVYLSSYVQGNRSDVLLNDVEKMTGMARQLVVSMTGSAAFEGMTMSQLFTADVLNKTGAKYGIGKEDWTEADWDAWAAENDTAYGNLLVLAAAEEVEYAANNAGYEMSPAGGIINDFSGYYAFAATNPEFSAVLTDYMDDLSSVTTASQGAEWYRNLEAAANQAGYVQYSTGEQGEVDQYAFASILSALGNPNEEQASNIAANLNQSDLFTNGVVNNMYNDYMNAVDMMVAPALSGGQMAQINLGEGEAAVYFTMINGELRISDTLPTA